VGWGEWVAWGAGCGKANVDMGKGECEVGDKGEVKGR